MRIIDLNQDTLRVAAIIHEPGRMRAEEIEKSMYDYMIKYANAESRKFVVTEAFIPEEDCSKFGKIIKADSWYCLLRVDKPTFSLVENGDLDGFMDKMFNGSIKKSADGPMLKEEGEIILKGSENMTILELVEKFIGESVEKADVSEDEITEALETFASYEFPDDIHKAIRDVLVWISKVEKESSEETNHFSSIPLPVLPQELSKSEEDEIAIEKFLNSDEKDKFPSVPVPLPARLIEKINARLKKEEDEDDEDDE